MKTPGSVARLTAAVFVAAKADVKRSAAEMDALRKIVANALGVKAVSDAEVAKMVAIEEVSFPEGQQEAKSLIDQVAALRFGSRRWSDFGRADCHWRVCADVAEDEA